MTTFSANHRLPTSGESLGRWRLLERVGSGAFGIVFRAQLRGEPGTVAALKLAREPADRRFAREAELLDRARSPHLPRLLEQGEWRSAEGLPHPYLVMQWVEGVPLYAWAEQRGLTNATVTRVLAHVARALAEVHRHRGLHRDVKGENMLVGPDGFAVLVDLGVVTTIGASPLTEQGQLPPGTHLYRAPEALRFKRVGGDRYEATPADDVYALGVTAYRLVTGTYPPPPGTSLWSGAVSRKRLPPSEFASVCPELERIILRMLSKRPADRLSAEENARSLEALLASGVPQLAGAIVPTAAMKETEKAARPGPRQPLAIPRWLVGTGSSALGALLALGVWSLATWVMRPAEPTDARVQWEEQEDVRVRDTPSGLADAGVDEESALAARYDSPVAQLRMPFITKEMPQEPFKGQRKPPCVPMVETAIRGACWVEVGRMTPPCGERAFDYDGRCYIPSFNGPRHPTSGEP
jgi:hypothetical protein